MARTYDMTNRSAEAAATADRIVTATQDLLARVPVRDITLQDIAQDSGVSVQTVLRHMESREGCFTAVGVAVAGRVDAQRGHTEPGDVRAAVTALVDHYEAEGRLILNLLAQESDGPIPREAAESGRAYHRAWVLRCFGPLLATRSRTTVDALVAATDLYVWKLLRLDLGRSRRATEQVINRIVDGVLEQS